MTDMARCSSSTSLSAAAAAAVSQVTSYSLPLREIDTVQGDDGPDGGYVPNALEVVVRKTHLDMLEVREVWYQRLAVRVRERV
jgi:hypothetical protein